MKAEVRVNLYDWWSGLTEREKDYYSQCGTNTYEIDATLEQSRENDDMHAIAAALASVGDAWIVWHGPTVCFWQEPDKWCRGTVIEDGRVIHEFDRCVSLPDLKLAAVDAGFADAPGVLVDGPPPGAYE